MEGIPDMLATVGRRMETLAPERGGLSYLRERRELEPAFRHALAARPEFGELAQKDRKIEVPGWRRVGRLDVIVRTAPRAPTIQVAIELKWCASGQLYEAIWDLFKLALLTTGPGAPEAYLATAAPTGVWERDPCAALFSDAEHSTLALCRMRFAGRTRRFIWDDLLAGGYDSYPEALPAKIQTMAVGAFPMHSGDERWELRMARVCVPRCRRIPFDGGWPYGKRPLAADRPLTPS